MLGLRYIKNNLRLFIYSVYESVHSTKKMNPKVETFAIYIEYTSGARKKKQDFKITKNIKIKKAFFWKGYALHLTKEVFVVKQVTNIVLWMCVIENVNAVKKVVIKNYKKLNKMSSELRKFWREKVTIHF